MQTYTSFLTTMGLNMVVSTTDPNFLLFIPNCIDDMEQRLYRRLDLLNTVTRDSSSAATTSSRTFNLPVASGTFIVTEQINVITPAGTTDPEAGTRNGLVAASKELLDVLWPSSTGSTVPQYYAPITQNQIIFGPWPDQAYQIEVVGTIRPPALSTSVSTTLLSVYFPDLMIAAAMVYATGYQRNFGAMVDDPKAAISWENHLQELLQSAETEEQRKKLNMAGWSSKQPAPQATPPRT